MERPGYTVQQQFFPEDGSRGAARVIINLPMAKR